MRHLKPTSAAPSARNYGIDALRVVSIAVLLFYCLCYRVFAVGFQQPAIRQNARKNHFVFVACSAIDLLRHYLFRALKLKERFAAAENRLRARLGY